MSLRAFATGGSGVNPYTQGMSREQRGTVARSSDGYWEFDVLQNAVIRLHIPAMAYERVFVVPEKNAINLADIRSDVAMTRGGRTRDRIHYV
jgi:hypothetical protein